ncbi:hypothetical protein AAG906_019377 [Vitis piasezkii]
MFAKYQANAFGALCTKFLIIGYRCNLDERVSERVLYDILIQVGRWLCLREYETEEIAEYAISGQDKPSPAAITPRHHVPYNNMESSQHSMGLKTPCRLSAHPVNNAQGDHPLMCYTNLIGIVHNMMATIMTTVKSFGATLDNISRSRSRYYDSSSPVTYPSY